MNFPYVMFNKCSKQINIKVNNTMTHIHWIGTGLSSLPGIRRLAKNLENLTIWNRTLEKAENSINHVSKNNIKAKKFDIDLIFKETNPGDIVISQLPATRHPEIAKLCLKHKCHFASTSYLNSEILALDKDVKQQNLVFINEIGLDPGIDHFFSHLLVQDLKRLSSNDIEVIYESYCGGFPAVPNDFKYKFSWSPAGVIKALNNDAKFISKGEIKTVTPYKSISSYTINDENFEAYPNRDSTPYVNEYNFDRNWRIKEFVRGTLRLDGWKDAWKDIFSMLENQSDTIEDDINKKSEELLIENRYKAEEEDRVVLSVKLKGFENNNKIFDSSYFLDEKGSGENTAMGKLVSITLSAAIDLMIEDKIKPGVKTAPHDNENIMYFFKILKDNNINIQHKNE